MDAWREMMDVMEQARTWEVQLQYSLNEGQLTPQLAQQLEQTLGCQGHCRDKVQQWQRAFDQGQPGQTNFPEAWRFSQEYLAVQRELVPQLEAIRHAAVQALAGAGRGGPVPARFDSCRRLLERLLYWEQELCDLESGPPLCVQTLSVYAPPEYFFMDTLPKAEKPAPSGGTRPYPKNFAADSSEPEGFAPPQVQPVYAAPPRKEKK